MSGTLVHLSAQVSKKPAILIGNRTILVDDRPTLVANRPIERLSTIPTARLIIRTDCHKSLSALDLRINPILFGPMARLLQYGSGISNKPLTQRRDTMKATTKLTTQQSAEIRKMVDLYGWVAVRKHPVLGPLWRAVMAEQRRIENRIDA